MSAQSQGGTDVPASVPQDHVRIPVPRLHVLTDDSVVQRPDFLERAIEILHALGPHGAFHLRTRLFTGGTLLTLAERLREVAAESGTLMVMNDRVDVAVAAGISAVQLGSASLRPADVVRIAPSLRIGVSIHDAATVRTLIAEAPEQVVRQMAWIMAGHIYDTPSHPDAPASGLGMLSAVRECVKTPVIAVGGIRPAHIASVLHAGAAGVAVISGIWSERTPKDAVMRYLSSVW